MIRESWLRDAVPPVRPGDNAAVCAGVYSTVSWNIGGNGLELFLNEKALPVKTMPVEDFVEICAACKIPLRGLEFKLPVLPVKFGPQAKPVELDDDDGDDEEPLGGVVISDGMRSPPSGEFEQAMRDAENVTGVFGVATALLGETTGGKENNAGDAVTPATAVPATSDGDFGGGVGASTDAGGGSGE